MKRTRTWYVAVAVGLFAIILGGRSASAEVFFDLYGGASIFSDPNVTVSREGRERETERFGSDTKFTIGGRGGYWFDGQGLRWLGVALDISYFEPEYTRQGGTADLVSLKVQTLPITPLAMFRWSLLTAPEHPNGQLQLYTGIGPAFFVRDGTAHFVSGREFSESGMSIGVDFRAGIAYEFLPNWAVFAEYRFTHFSVSPEGRVEGQKTKVEADFATNHVLVGVSLRFR